MALNSHAAFPKLRVRARGGPQRERGGGGLDSLGRYLLALVQMTAASCRLVCSAVTRSSSCKKEEGGKNNHLFHSLKLRMSESDRRNVSRPGLGRAAAGERDVLLGRRSLAIEKSRRETMVLIVRAPAGKTLLSSDGSLRRPGGLYHRTLALIASAGGFIKLHCKDDNRTHTQKKIQ